MTQANSGPNRQNSGQTATIPETAPCLEGVDPPKRRFGLGTQGRVWWGLVVVGWLAMLVFTFHACTRMVAAGDTWVAMACGRHFTNHGVDTNEPFSANSHHEGPTEKEVETWPDWAKRITNIVGLDTVRKWHPTGWVNQNWLTHEIFYRVTTGLGSEEEPFYDALVYWKVGLYFLAMISIYAMGRLLGVHPGLAATAACFSLFIGRTFLDIRPAGFSNLMVPLMMLILVLATVRHYRYIWLLIPMTVFWSNVHGGYIYVFIMLVPFIGLHLMTTLPPRWTSWLYGALGWLALYVLCLKLVKHPGLANISFLGGKYIFLILVMAGIGLGLTLTKSILDRHVHLYHALASILVFMLLFLGGLFPQIHYNVVGKQLQIVQSHLGTARMGFLGLFGLYLALGAIVVFAKRTLVTLSPRAVGHMIGAYVAALVAAIVFNPFHLTNLTHTFIISMSENAKRWRDVHEWHPAFDWSNPVGTAKPFLVMYILVWLAFLVLLIVRWMTREAPMETTELPLSEAVPEKRSYQRPKIDLPLLVIGALTIYMAIRSRRFIPIAAFVACPLLAMLVQQIIEGVVALSQKSRSGKWAIPGLPVFQQQQLAGAALILVLTLGVTWGGKFKRIYLDSWPTDPEYHSVFMRMTASYLKPFKACAFLRQNKIEGNMMNYWTEGGAVAFGQAPDPNTGRTPLQLFMDGRAQAAYDVTTFNTWSYLWAGGEKGYAIRRKKDKAKRKEWEDLGRWMGTELKRRNVWVALIPAKEWLSYFARALDYAENWRVVFVNNKQKMYVNREDPRGRALLDGVLTGETVYPDEFTRETSLAYQKLLYGRDRELREQGFEHAVKAFKLRPSGVPSNLLFEWVAREPANVPAVIALVDEYLQDFLANRDKYSDMDGYRYRLDAAFRCAQYLLKYEQRRSNPDAVNTYGDLLKEFEQEFRWIGESKRW